MCCIRVSQKKRPSLGLCLESLLGRSRCVEGVEAGYMGGSLCSGGDVMNRSGDSCVYQWLCSGWEVRMRSPEMCRLISRKGSFSFSDCMCEMQSGMKIGDKGNVLLKFNTATTRDAPPHHRCVS